MLRTLDELVAQDFTMSNFFSRGEEQLRREGDFAELEGKRREKSGMGYKGRRRPVRKERGGN
jgi:hypothetical protein